MIKVYNKSKILGCIAMRLKSYWILCLLFITCLAYAGEFGNYCLLSLSEGHFLKTDCSVNALYKGKEYCFGSEVSKEIFLKTPDEFIKKAAIFYEKNKDTDRKKISQEEMLKEIKSPDCDFSNKDLGYLDMNGLDLSHCKMLNTSVFGANLIGVNLANTNMQRAYLNLARLEKANLSGANLTEATIFQAIFGETVFKGANLSRARVIGTLGAVDMSGATIKNGQFGLDVGNQPMGQMKFDSVGGKFYKANFEGADLNIASFLFGDLREANLKNTNMYRADLGQADLTGADLTNADLTDANVEGAIFTNVKGLSTVKGFSTVKGKCRDCGMP
jgi:uncharacterized protein YjbI with pentapeptide repeats/YHS domain-containing protein